MRIVVGDKAMEVYYWEGEGEKEVDLDDLAGAVVTIGSTKLVLIPQGFDDSATIAILEKMWPERYRKA